MPPLSERQSSSLVKLIYIGNSGSGKTGSLVSLVKAGYKLRILDFDSGLDPLVYQIRRQCPDKIDNVEYEFLRDEYRPTAMGLKFKPPAKAHIEASRLLETWPDGSKMYDLGPDYIVVIDSLTALGQAARNFSESINPAVKDPRQWYSDAQDKITSMIATLTSDRYNTNVLILSHIDYRDTPEGITKGFVSAIGKALGPKIPLYFNTIVRAETRGTGDRVKRTISTLPTAMIDLKNPAPETIEATYDLNTGLAEIFAKLKSQ